MVFKHIVKIFPRNYIQKQQYQLQRAVSSSYIVRGPLNINLLLFKSVSYEYPSFAMHISGMLLFWLAFSVLENLLHFFIFFFIVF